VRRSLLALLAGLLLADPAGAAWTTGSSSQTAPITTVTPYEQTFTTTLGPLTGLNTSACSNPLLLSFDASTGDASSDARLRWFSCETVTSVTTGSGCQEIPIRNLASGATLNEYTDFQFDNSRAALVPVADAPTVGGDTAKMTVKCSVFAEGPLVGGGAGITDGDKGDIVVGSAGVDWQIKPATVGTLEVTDNSLAAADIASGAVLGPETGVGAINQFSDLDVGLCAEGQILERGATAWQCITTPTGGAGVTDGDKVDIVVSDTGATWQIKTASVGAPELADSGVSAAVYGSATQCPQLTLDADGRATAASSVTITPASGSIVFSGGDPFWTTECPGIVDADAALECLAANKVNAADLTSVSESTSAPAGNCINPGGQCMHYQKAGSGDFVSAWFGVDGEAFGTDFAVSTAAGKISPANPAHGLEIGDEALGSKDHRFPVNGPAYHTHGVDGPTTLPHWKTARLGATGVIYAGGNDRALNMTGAWSTMSLVGSGQAISGFIINSTHDLRVGNYAFQVLDAAAGFDAGDTLQIKAYGCTQSDLAGPLPFFQYCDDLGTLIHLCGSGVGGCTATVDGTTSEGNLAYFKDKDDAPFFDFISFGIRWAGGTDTSNDLSVSIMGSVEFEN
jgi:hypothetical protein